MAKRGRKPKHHVTAKGETVVGLTLSSDGRFRPVGVPGVSFGKDERTAIHRFRIWSAAQQDVELEPLEDTGFNDIAFRLAEERQRIRDLIFTHPKRAALDLDCEPLALLAKVVDLEKMKPEPSLPLAACLRRYLEKRKTVSSDEAKKTKSGWNLFTCSVKPAKTLEDVTEERFESWVDIVFLPYQDGDGSPKTVRHKIDRVGRILRYCKTNRGKNPSDPYCQYRDKRNCERLLDLIEQIELPELNGENPNPIRVADYRALLKAGEKSIWEPILLTMMNLCFYPCDIRRLTVGSIDWSTGSVVFERQKRKTTRVGILWQRTLASLERWLADHPSNDAVFTSQLGEAFSGHGLRNAFRRFRAQTDVGDDVTMDRIRDGAYSAACGHPGVSEKEVKILAGHKFSGESDAYVKRDSRMVASACHAIEEHYFGGISK